MPENSPACARAYVGSPVTAESGVFLAIRWAFTLDHALGWSSIGIIVPDSEGEHRLSHLYRMRSRGVRIGTIDQALTTRAFSGVMIAYRPGPLALAKTQDIPGAIGVVALAADRGGLQPWVDAYHPDHLGGEAITPTPDPPPAGLLERILGSYTTRFTTRVGPLPPGEQQISAEALHQLRRHGHFHPPEALLAIALRVGWPGEAAWDLHRLALGRDTADTARPATRSHQPAQRTPSI